VKSFQATIVFDEHGRALIQLPAEVTPGPHRVVVVIDEQSGPREPLTFSAHNVGPWPEGFSVRREEIYGNDER
jgi:hypothetical protein